MLKLECGAKAEKLRGGCPRSFSISCFAAAMSAASARAAIAAAGVLSLLALANEVADD